MKISSRTAYDVLVVEMEGRLDSQTSGYGYDELVRIAKSGNKHILINLEKLEFISSAGLRALLVAAKLLATAGGQLRLCNATESVQRMLVTSGFDSLLHLYPTESEAIKGF